MFSFVTQISWISDQSCLFYVRNPPSPVFPLPCSHPSWLDWSTVCLSVCPFVRLMPPLGNVSYNDAPFCPFDFRARELNTNIPNDYWRHHSLFCTWKYLYFRKKINTHIQTKTKVDQDPYYTVTFLCQSSKMLYKKCYEKCIGLFNQL